MWIHGLIVLLQVVAARFTLPMMSWKENRGEASPGRCWVTPAGEGTNIARVNDVMKMSSNRSARDFFSMMKTATESVGLNPSKGGRIESK